MSLRACPVCALLLRSLSFSNTPKPFSVESLFSQPWPTHSSASWAALSELLTRHRPHSDPLEPNSSSNSRTDINLRRPPAGRAHVRDMIETHSSRPISAAALGVTRTRRLSLPPPPPSPPHIRTRRPRCALSNLPLHLPLLHRVLSTPPLLRRRPLPMSPPRTITCL